MDWREELKQLVRLCSKKPDKTMSRRFPKEENEPLAERIRHWLEQHENELNTAVEQTEIRQLRQKLYDFLILHKAASRGPIPASGIRCYVVIDTNIFFHHENILDRLDESCLFVLPAIVLDELRNQLRFKNAKSRQSQRILNQIKRFPSCRILRLNVNDLTIRRSRAEFPAKTQNDLCDDRILAAAKHLLMEKKPTRLLSDDVELRKRADELGIPALSLREFFADW